MANKKQLRGYKLHRILVATVGSTNTRTTKINDVQFNKFPWTISNSVLACQNKFARKDIV